jgi:hypothetical protein
MMAPERFTDEQSTDAFMPKSPTRCQQLLKSQASGGPRWRAADGLQILPSKTTRCANPLVARDFGPNSLGPDPSFAQLLKRHILSVEG